MSDTCDRSPYCYGDTELFAEIERLRAENEVLREQNLAMNKTGVELRGGIQVAIERITKALEQEHWRPVMRTFDHFPENALCVVCGKNTDKPCVLIPIADTSDGRICQATPVHADCVSDEKAMVFDPNVRVIYIATLLKSSRGSNDL